MRMIAPTKASMTKAVSIPLRNQFAAPFPEVKTQTRMTINWIKGNIPTRSPPMKERAFIKRELSMYAAYSISKNIVTRSVRVKSSGLIFKEEGPSGMQSL